MGLSELYNRQADLLVIKSKLQRELERRKKFDVGIFYVNDDPILLRSVTAIEKDLRDVEKQIYVTIKIRPETKNIN